MYYKVWYRQRGVKRTVFSTKVELAKMLVDATIEVYKVKGIRV